MSVPPTIRERLEVAAEQLEAVSETPRLDAEILLAHALGWRRAQLLARLRERHEAPEFDAMLARRLCYEPLAHILGTWEFFGLSFEVRPPLLCPRPETEHLVECILAEVDARPAAVLELGTGTGCVAVALARQARATRIIATDINPLALTVARRNALRHEVERRVRFVRGDLLEPFRARAQFDVVCSNPPYVEEAAWQDISPVVRLHEDPAALLAGPDGLAVIRKIARQSGAVLRPGGLLCFELGEGQDDEVEKILIECGFTEVSFIRDLAGTNRIAKAHRPR